MGCVGHGWSRALGSSPGPPHSVIVFYFPICGVAVITSPVLEACREVECWLLIKVRASEQSCSVITYCHHFSVRTLEPFVAVGWCSMTK